MSQKADPALPQFLPFSSCTLAGCLSFTQSQSIASIDSPIHVSFSLSLSICFPSASKKQKNILLDSSHPGHTLNCCLRADDTEQ